MYSLIDLLPYNSTVVITDLKLAIQILKITTNILKDTYNAYVDFYHDKKWISFDAHVGENSCQIRASKILEIASQSAGDYREKINLAFKRYQSALNLLHAYEEKLDLFNKRLYKFTSENETIASNLKKWELDCDISENDYYLALSYILTRFKIIDTHENTAICIESMKKAYALSRHKCVKLVHYYQKQLASLSISHIYCLAKTHEQSEVRSKIYNLLVYHDDDARKVMPCFLITKLILKAAKKNCANITITTRLSSGKVICLYYRFNRTKNQYEYIEKPEATELNQPVLALHGIASNSNDEKEYLRDLTSHSLDYIIMANQAAHPQYSGKRLSGVRDNPFHALTSAPDKFISRWALEKAQTLLDLRLEAKRLGFSEENSKRFYIRHIFTDNLRNQLHQAVLNRFYSDYHDPTKLKKTNIYYNQEVTEQVA